MPDTGESKWFWSDMSDEAVMQRENSDWARKVENELKEPAVLHTH